MRTGVPTLRKQDHPKEHKMPENVQYETTSPARSVPTKASNMRSTLDVSPERALSTISAVVRKNLREMESGGVPLLGNESAS